MPDRCDRRENKCRGEHASVLTHSLASRFCDGECFFGSAVLCEDGFGAGGPPEGLWVLVSMLDPLANRGLEFGDVVEGSPPDALASDFSEEPLDEVRFRGAERYLPIASLLFQGFNLLLQLSYQFLNVLDRFALGAFSLQIAASGELGI